MVHTIRACRGVTARLVIPALVVTGCSTNQSAPNPCRHRRAPSAARARTGLTNKGFRMLSWTVIGYGAALSALAATILVAVAARERRRRLVAGAAAGALLGAAAWNATLRATHANQF